MKVGDTIWRFDHNIRVYPERRPGETYTHARPIYRRQWRPEVITGETSRSWIIHGGRWDETKVPKKPNPIQKRQWCFSEAELEGRVWWENNHCSLADAVRDCRNPEVLRKIASIPELGYTEKTE